MAKVDERRTPYRLCCHDDNAVHPREPSACVLQENASSKFALPLSKVNAVDIIAVTRRLGGEGGRKSRISVENSRRTPLSLLPSLLFSKEFSSVSYLMEYQGFRTQEERNSLGYSRLLQKRQPVPGRKRTPAATNEFTQVLDISRPISLSPRYTASAASSPRRSVTSIGEQSSADATSVSSQGANSTDKTNKPHYSNSE